ncbi:hypothetical protein H0X09_03830 [Candidatus Saccharibacteria bacterium]|nr:hypothetical protein [Candidatus Saccharibacteria bacterium]
MTSSETLGHSVTIDEEEVYSLIHNVKSVREIQPTQFTGRVAIWGEIMEQKGNRINPKLTYMEGGHRTSWVENEGIDEATGEEFCIHHVVCDCSGNYDENSPQKVVKRTAKCLSALKALQRRAAYVDYTYRTTEVLDALRDPTAGDFEQSNTFHKVAVKTIANIIELDIRHPEEWPANVINGQHQASILATLLQVNPEVVKWYGRFLEEKGIVVFDGETLTPSDDLREELRSAA